MTYTKTNWVANVTPVTAVSMNNIENGIGQLSAATSTTPPGSPVDGQIWYLPADATNGVVWTFRYNAGSASAYKWEFVGGAPASFYVGAGAALGTTGWTLGPTPLRMYVPRAGDYFAVTGVQLGGVSSDLISLGFGRTGTIPISLVGSVAQRVTGDIPTMTLADKALGIPAGDYLAAAYSSTGSGVTISSRYLHVSPVRVS